MNNRFSKTIWLVFVAAFIFAGCEQGHKNDKVDVLASGPNLETLGVPPDYAARAIEATRGLDTWTRTKELEFDCVVTFYQPDDSFYLTEQHYEVYPWSNSIRISGQEPQGRFVWQLSKGRFDAVKGGEQFDGLPSVVESHYFAEVILNIITAPVRFLDESVEFTKVPEPVRIQGQWYYPIERRMKPALEVVPDLSDAVFYQNRDSSLIDMLWFADIGSSVIASEAQPSAAIPVSFAVRGYDYSEVEKRGVLVPTKIEIFGTDARGDSKKRLVEIDCHTLRRAK